MSSTANVRLLDVEQLAYECKDVSLRARLGGSIGEGDSAPMETMQPVWTVAHGSPVTASRATMDNVRLGIFPGALRSRNQAA